MNEDTTPIPNNPEEQPKPNTFESIKPPDPSANQTVENIPTTPLNTPEPKQPFYRNKRTVAILVMLVALIGVTAGWYMFSNKSPEQAVQQTQKVKLLGTDVTVVDGLVQISKDGTNWQDLKLETAVNQGDTIRTSDNGRAVITLDDGSALRVNSTSTVKLNSLSAANVVITNVEGEVYTRVVKSDRVFSVKVGDESYVALGTAYKTTNRDTTKGVEVYQSEVSAKTAEQKIAEGKRYYQTSPSPELDKKVTDIPADQLQKDDFLKWNLEYDKKNSEYSDKLGYLNTLEKTPAPIPNPTPATNTTSAAGITLAGSATEKGVSLSWKVSGFTVTKGFKVVKGTAANPVYGKQDATFVEASARSTTWKITDGKAYHFRICSYNSDGTCTNYSNNVTVTAPYTAPPAEPTGSLSLSHVSGNTVAWTLSGSAPYGLKLVSSTSPEPTYPGSSAKYFEGASNSSATFEGDSGSTYYLRICMYYEGTCKNYSNQITVTLP